jgi:hypothetical protein
VIHHRQRQEIWWFVPGSGYNTNQTVLIYNYGAGEASGSAFGAWSVRSGIEAASGVLLDTLFLTGNYAGQIYHQLSGNTYDGQSIPWRYQSPFLDFGNSLRRKRLKQLVCYIGQLGQVNLTLKTAWDFKRSQNQRESISLSVSPSNISSVFGSTSYGTAQYDSNALSLVSVTPNGSGKTFQVELSGNALNQPVDLHGYQLSAIVGGDR